MKPRKISVILLFLLLAGCASIPGRPHTEYEKRLLAAAIVGHCLDAATTSAAVGSGDFVEANGVYADYGMEHNGGVLAVKGVMIGTTYLLGSLLPSQRVRIYKGSIWAGYGPAVWNTYQMTTE